MQIKHTIIGIICKTRFSLINTVFFSVCLLAFACGGKDSGTFEGTLPQKTHATTQKGVEVFSQSNINAANLPLIDAGLDKAFFIAANPPNNYIGFNTHPSYTVWLFPRSNQCENPGFLLSADGSVYEGSIYDKNPDPAHCDLCVAGMQIRPGASMENIGSPGMVVVDDLGIMLAIIRFESEHNILIETDRERYAATQYHVGTGGGHPIMPDESGNLVVDTLPFAVESNRAKHKLIVRNGVEFEGRMIVRPGEAVNALVVK